MLLKHDSELFRIPSALDLKQSAFIEGIRVCLQMIDLAHARLQQTLMAMESCDASLPESRSLFTAAMLDAWSMVDSIHRLGELAAKLPYVDNRKQLPGFVLLQKNIANINALRNVIQHLSTNIPKSDVEAPTWSVWGSLSWCSQVGNQVKVTTYMCGQMKGGSQRPTVEPWGRKLRQPAGMITLTVDTVSVCLSDLMDDVERFAVTIDAMATKAFSEKPEFSKRRAADVLIHLVFEVEPDPGTV